MKRLQCALLAAILLLAPVAASLAADVKPLVNAAGQVRPVHTGETVGVPNGGTGATTASAARTGLGLGTFATQDYATPPAIGGTTPAAGAFSTLSATGNLTTNVTGSTQCLHVNSSGVVSGVGSDCGAGGSAITFKDEGSTLTAATTSVDCVGAGITCTNSTGAVTVTVSGGGSGISSGASFPGSPATNDLYYRTDRSLLYFYNGTRWLTVQRYTVDLRADVALPVAANTSARGPLSWDATATDFWVETFTTQTFVAGTNTGSAFWTLALGKTSSANVFTSIASVNTSADAANTWIRHASTVNALLGTSSVYLEMTLAKTSTPGSVYVIASVVGRLVG